MSTPSTAPDTRPDSPQSNYFVLGAGSLAVIALALLGLNVGRFGTLIVVLVGLVGLLLRWRGAALVLLGVLALVLQLVLRAQWIFGRGPQVAELLLAAGMLCFCVSHYRLIALTSTIIPADPRLRKGQPRWELGFLRLRRRPPVVRVRRPVASFAANEIVSLLVTLPGCAILAQFVWQALYRHRFWPIENPGLIGPLWRFILLTWAIGVAAMVSRAVLGWWTRRHMTRDEAALLLQDTLWKETRREQRLINRWRAWYRIRRRRKETTQ